MGRLCLQTRHLHTLTHTHTHAHAHDTPTNKQTTKQNRGYSLSREEVARAVYERERERHGKKEITEGGRGKEGRKIGG